MGVFDIPFHKWVLDCAKGKFGASNIKSRRKNEEIGILGAYDLELKDGRKFLAYFHYQLEGVVFEEIKEDIL
jgi:hypothetical protein